jgi:hypothetical protein
MPEVDGKNNGCETVSRVKKSSIGMFRRIIQKRPQPAGRSNILSSSGANSRRTAASNKNSTFRRI